MSVRILTGDCRDVLRSLPDESVNCCVTSPPYFGLRDYGVDGQIGLEQTPEAFVAEMVAVFREVRRVLRKDGTLWLNIGDSYAANRSYQVPQSKHQALDFGKSNAQRVPAGLKAKDRMMVPARVALGLQADGWWIRDEIIWHKPNVMPSSVEDRTTPSHEMVYMLTRSARYAYDLDAIKEPAVCEHPSGNGYARPEQVVRGGRGAAKGWMPTELRQPRSVWSICTQPYGEAHFATMAPDLVEKCIKAGCPAGGTVLDPFGGAGTTGLVADRLGRDAILIELNPAYATMARDRLARDGGMFASVAAE
ncbi:site-specific DNA-methyltransferase [Methylobacterium sp. P1-11]|uniref:DNA-methyltransferase n=1 Tax=Methylobacterium sp. P1-11 TaxID=2024616 RepID=UPI0011EEBD43|nr:site-specific DNA-methyltransferase [Methylobacterium sp. P1-11]KAA0117861.1 site-specific DNA-methyltransferase [Methylobacterium sp. P1-11]